MKNIEKQIFSVLLKPKYDGWAGDYLKSYIVVQDNNDWKVKLTIFSKDHHWLREEDLNN